MIVTSRDFRANQSRYINIAHSGEDVILKSRAGSVRLIPVTQDSVNTDERDLAAELRNALSDVKKTMQGKEKLSRLEELLGNVLDKAAFKYVQEHKRNEARAAERERVLQAIHRIKADPDSSIDLSGILGKPHDGFSWEELRDEAVYDKYGI